MGHQGSAAPRWVRERACYHARAAPHSRLRLDRMGSIIPELPQLRRIFEPIQIGSRVARNRIASTPHTTGFGVNGYPTERYALYHAAKARGGAGLVMTFGSCCVHPSSPLENGAIAAWDDGVIPHLQRMSDLVHGHGALIVSQISHRGRRSTSTSSERALLAPSDLPEPTHREVPHALEAEQI